MRTRTVLSIPITIALLLGACGSGETESAGSSTAAPTTTQLATTVTTTAAPAAAQR